MMSILERLSNDALSVLFGYFSIEVLLQQMSCDWGSKFSLIFFLIISWYTNIIILTSGKYSMTVSVQELGQKQIVKGSKHSTFISKSVLHISTIPSYYFRYGR